MPKTARPSTSIRAAQAKSPKRLTLAEHLEELRRRLGISLATLLVTIGGSFTQADRLMVWVKRPVDGLLPRFAFFSPTEPLTAYINLSILAGVVVAMPIILWQLWAFVRSGLTARERAYGLGFVCWGSFQFIAGVAFAYYLLLPASLRFLLGIGGEHLQPVISIERYLSFVMTLLWWCGLVFELPILLVMLAKAGIITPEWLRQQRSYAVLVSAIIAAVVTPTTDPVNMLLMMVPMVLLYECSILVIRLVVRQTPRSSL